MIYQVSENYLSKTSTALKLCSMHINFTSESSGGFTLIRGGGEDRYQLNSWKRILRTFPFLAETSAYPWKVTNLLLDISSKENSDFLKKLIALLSSIKLMVSELPVCHLWVPLWPLECPSCPVFQYCESTILAYHTVLGRLWLLTQRYYWASTWLDIRNWWRSDQVST